MLTDLTGQIERITFSNEENGFTIAKVKVGGRADLVTVVGALMAPSPGEVLEMKGEWTQHPKFGQQFKVAAYKSVVPASVLGIRKYLGSGLIKGLVMGDSLADAARAGAVCASYAVECHGTQEHIFSEENFWTRYERNFGRRHP